MGFLYRLFHDGYNRTGYDRNGYDRDGYDGDGYDRGGYNEDGYDRGGYNEDGYDRDGYNGGGYDRDGYDIYSYNKFRIHKSVLNHKFVMPEEISCSNYDDCSQCKDLFRWNKPGIIYEESPYIMRCDDCCFRNASVTTISDSSQNQNLYIVKIWEGISHLNENAFKSKEMIKEVFLPESIIVIPDKTFSNCINLENICLPKSLEHIGEYAFDHCKSLSTIELKENMKIIGEFAFRMCSNLENVSMHSHQISAYMSSFYGCKKLTDVYYNSVCAPKSILIPYITNLYLGDKVTAFSNEATIFEGKKLPSDLSEIKIKIHVSPDNTYLIMEDGVLFSKDKSTLISFNCQTATTYKIPSYVKEIGDFAFANTKLTRIEFHDAIRRFNISCIYGVEGLGVVANTGSYVDKCVKENNLREDNHKFQEEMQNQIHERILRAQCGPTSLNKRHTTR